MTFDEWNNPETHPEGRTPTARQIWDAEVKAERERCAEVAQACAVEYFIQGMTLCFVVADRVNREILKNLE
jgi:DNA-binding transcriptional regulator YbjK